MQKKSLGVGPNQKHITFFSIGILCLLLSGCLLITSFLICGKSANGKMSWNTQSKNLMYTCIVSSFLSFFLLLGCLFQRNKISLYTSMLMLFILTLISFVILIVSIIFSIKIQNYNESFRNDDNYLTNENDLSKKQKEVLDQVKKEIQNKPLTFIHIPKCAGTFVRNFLPKINKTKNKSLRMLYKSNHDKATYKDVPAIAIIRDPLERFESMLRFRFDRLDKYPDLQKIVHHLKSQQKKVSLNNIIEQMSDTEVLNIQPFRTLSFYKDNIIFMTTIDKFIPVLNYLGFNSKEVNMDLKINSTNVKDYDRLSQQNQNRIKKLYHDDFELYRKWTTL